MPQLKQPVHLEKLAFKFLVGHIVRRCDNLIVQEDRARLYQSVADIKQHIYNRVPGSLFAKICRKFLHDFYNIGARRLEDLPASHRGAALEFIMDVKIVGLTCEGRLVNYLDPSDAHRLQGLEVLDWSHLRGGRLMSRGLENYRLQDLTTFIFPRYCTDRDLEIIGSGCFKLQVLIIQESKGITDRGLRAVGSCSELRIIGMCGCPAVSNNGVCELLSAHGKLEEFDVGDAYNFIMPNSLVCPSVKRFVMRSDPVTHADLRSTVSLFPNLTVLGLAHSIHSDLCLLKDLKNLAKLDFYPRCCSLSVENLKQLLTSVGAKITRLTISYSICFSQNDLNFIHQVCPSIEKLKFNHVATMEKLVVPPFQKLRKLQCTLLDSTLQRSCYPDVLEFREMVSLEVLSITLFHQERAIFELTKTIMRDNIKFPKLRKMVIFSEYRYIEYTRAIKEYAKSNNLDFSFSNIARN